MPRGVLAVLLTLTLLTAGCTGLGGDADGDGLRDVDETATRSILVVTAAGESLRDVTSDPKVADTDGDGLDDFQEFSRSTDPRDIDTDDDGLLDGEDQRAEPGTERYERFISEGIVRSPTDPNLFLGEASQCKGIGGLNPTRWDSDRPLADGLGDGDELRGWDVTLRGQVAFVQSSPCTPDTDGDGLSDLEERDIGTDPGAADTDGDGVDDIFDADPLWNLHLTIKLTSIKLKRDKDTEGGADLRFTVQLAERTRTFQKDVGAAGNHDLGFTLDAVDVDDTSPTRGELEVVVQVQVLDADVSGDEHVRIFGSQSTAILTVELFTGEIQAGDRNLDGTFSSEVEGQDAILRFTFETLRR